MYINAWVIMKYSPLEPKMRLHKISTDLNEVTALVTGKSYVDYVSKAIRIKVC